MSFGSQSKDISINNMEELHYYTNVAGAMSFNPYKYGLIYEDGYSVSNQKPFNEILENWDIISSNLDIPYMALPFLLWKDLAVKYQHINFKLIDSYFINNQCCCPPYGSITTVIKNPKNNKFILLSFCDQNFYIRNGTIPKEHPTYVSGYDSWDLDNCVDFFPMQGVHTHPTKYSLDQNFTWLPSDVDGRIYSHGLPVPSYSFLIMDHIEKVYQNTDRKIPEKLFIDCKVGGTEFRNEYLTKDDRFEISLGRNIPPIEFIEKLAQYSIIMDVNAVAEVSSRTFEGMGLGCAVIRPKLLIQYHNKLIPNYHYAAVDCDDLSDFKKLADGYIKKFEELKENPQLIEFYGKNGRKWYEENCVKESWIRIYRDELIRVDKLV